MAALWVREQSRGHTRILLLGKPSGRLDDFDLVILSGEVQMPARANVVKIKLPLMRVPVAAVDAARERSRPKLADLPRPLIALLFQWEPGSTENPYLGLLALADGFVVTADSLSMMVEVAGLFGYTRDFTAIHDLLLRRGLATRAGEGFEAPRGELPDDLPRAVARIRSLLER